MYFLDTYEECRDDFINLSKSIKIINTKTEIKQIIIPSKIDNDLSIDICFMPAKSKQENLIIVSSGVHGIEGFAGSAVQRMIMKEIIPDINPDNNSFLFIHSLNPFGHKYLRRFTENNIDLNRNFDIDKNIFSIKNDSYKLIYDFLNPKDKYSNKLFKNIYFLFKTLKLIKKFKIGTLRQSILQGQYEFEKGIFFGGLSFEPQKELLEKYLIKKIDKHKKILLIDLHTGYGERGKLYFFKIDNLNDNRCNELINNIYKDHEIVGGDANAKDTNFYMATSSFAEYIYKLSKNKICIPMTYEFGTINSHKTLGQIKSLEIMVNENQCYQNGYKKIKDKDVVLTDFKELYYPSDNKWRNKVLNQCKYYLPDILNRFISY